MKENLSLKLTILKGGLEASEIPMKLGLKKQSDSMVTMFENLKKTTKKQS